MEWNEPDLDLDWAKKKSQEASKRTNINNARIWRMRDINICGAVEVSWTCNHIKLEGKKSAEHLRGGLNSFKDVKNQYGSTPSIPVIVKTSP